MSAPQDKSPWVNFRPHQFPGVDGIVERQEHPKNRLSDQALSRIAKAYNYCWSIAETKEFSLWGSIIFKRHSLFHEVAKQENLGRLRAMLEWPATNDLFYGFDNLYQEISSTCREGSPELKGYGLICMDRLVTLAEAVGARRQWHPEADTWADPIQQSPDDVIGSIEKVLGIRLDFPSPFRQAFGLPTARGLVSDRAIHAIYLAFRMVQLSQQPARSVMFSGDRRRSRARGVLLPSSWRSPIRHRGYSRDACVRGLFFDVFRRAGKDCAAGRRRRGDCRDLFDGSRGLPQTPEKLRRGCERRRDHGIRA